MCGIAGIYSPSSALEAAETCHKMTSTLNHRGPDFRRVWSHTSLPLSIGHARLSIIDLSQDGHQPMTSRCGRYVISFNGEIYNFPQLRIELQKTGVHFRGSSDTEVLLEGLANWGISETLERVIGMFAIAIWDDRLRKLFLVRDRIGIKPLYWTHSTDGSFAFGSELKALLQLNGQDLTVDAEAVGAFLKCRYVPAPKTIFSEINKLSPGTILCWNLNEAPSITRFWDLDQVTKASALEMTDQEALGELESILEDAVRIRKIADVPIGCLLSGGIYSSLVAALMQNSASTPINTFSIGFRDMSYDETPRAKKIAQHLGTCHEELFVDPKNMLTELPNIFKIFDEPFSDSSQLPSLLVCSLARKKVKVALSGDGGDEVFAGYERYRTAPFFSKMHSLPQPVIDLLRRGSRMLYDTLGATNSINALLNKRVSNPQEKLFKLDQAMQHSSIAELYDGLRSVAGFSPHLLSYSLPESLNVHVETKQNDYLRFMQYRDTKEYLPDDVLTKVDRVSMAHGLEVRVPLLDHRLIEFMWRQPNRRKVRLLETKWMLKSILRRYVPESLTRAPKSGFAVPLNSWLRGDLREFVDDSLKADPKSMAEFFEPNSVMSLYEDFLHGKNNCGELIWSLVVFRNWQRNYLER